MFNAAVHGCHPWMTKRKEILDNGEYTSSVAIAETNIPLDRVSADTTDTLTYL